MNTTLIIEITRTDGGCTWDALNNEPLNPSSGYAVGVRQFGASNNKQVLRAMLRIAANYSETIGTWVDAKTGNIHVDAVRIIEDCDTATTLAKSNGEIAIWDFANKEEIRIDA